MNEKLTDRNVLDDVLLTFLDGPMTPLPYDLSLWFSGIQYFQTKTVLVWSGPGLVWPSSTNFLLFMGLASLLRWVSGPGLLDHSLSLISVSNNGLLTSRVRHQAKLRVSRTLVLQFEYLCLTVNYHSAQTSQLLSVFTIHQRSEHWGGRKWSGPRLRHDWDPDLVSLSALSSRRSEEQLNEATELL